MPKVSIIIATHNRVELLSEAIDSVLQQTYKDFELIIIDDGSTDDTKYIVEIYIKKHPDKIRYIYQQCKGCTGAKNTGIKNARGNYIAFLDSDDQWMPNKLEKQIYLLENKNLDFVHCAAHVKRSNIVSNEVKPLSPANNFYDLFLGNKGVVMSTVLLKKYCFDAEGLFDKDVKAASDYDFWLKVFKKYKIGYVPHPLAIYRIHPNNLSSDIDLMRKDMIIIYTKMMKNATFPNELVKKKLSRTHYKLAKFYYNNGNNTKAIKEIIAAITINPFVGLTSPPPLENINKKVLFLLKPFAFLLLLFLLCIIKRK